MALTTTMVNINVYHIIITTNFKTKVKIVLRELLSGDHVVTRLGDADEREIYLEELKLINSMYDHMDYHHHFLRRTLKTISTTGRLVILLGWVMHMLITICTQCEDGCYKQRVGEYSPPN